MTTKLTEKDWVEIHTRHLRTNRLLIEENELLKAQLKVADRALRTVRDLLIMIKNREDIEDIRYLADEALEVISIRGLGRE